MSKSNPPPAANDDPENDVVDPEILELLKFTPAPRRVKRSDGWTPERQRCFVRLIVETGTPQRAAAAMGKKLSGAEQVYRSEGAEEFRAAWDKAVELAERREIGRLSRMSESGVADPPHWRRRRSEAEAPPQDQWEDEVDYSEDEKWDLIHNLASKFMKKVAQERDARLNGEIVAADFYLRQITFHEMTFDLTANEFGWDARQLLRDLQRGEHGIFEIISTPFADWLDEARREWWAQEGEPERPPHPDVRFLKRETSDEGDYSTGKQMHAGDWAAPPPGVGKEEWLKLSKAEQQALIEQIEEEDAAAQADWEHRAYEEWKERQRQPSP